MPNLFKIYDNFNFKYKSQSKFETNRSRVCDLYKTDKQREMTTSTQNIKFR